MEEEADESQQAPGGDVPLGVRLTGFFLGCIVVVLTVPMAVAGFVCLVSVGAAAHEPREGLGAILGALVMLGGFCVIMGALLGASWLGLSIRASHEDPARARWPHHPLRVILRPMIVAGKVYAVFAVVAWLTVMIASSGNGTSWTWLCFWAAVGTACHFLVRTIDRYPGAQ
jgi:hypothetical protein